MNYEYLNQMIEYIEEHLTEKIDYGKLAKIVGLSEQNLHRIFSFLTNMSLSEYIRKRRLSKAFEELKQTDIKIIDLALKYQYDSQISFARAFKKHFNITPSQCRKSDRYFKLFPICQFDNYSHNDDVIYEIKQIESKKIYCFSVKAVNHDDLLFKIRELYKYISDNGIRDIYDHYGMYGISISKNGLYEYFVGSEIKLDNAKELVIDKGKYAIFEVGNVNQNEIVKVYNFVYNKWLKSTNYNVIDKPEIEFYDKDNCYLYIPIEDKQK